MQRRALLATLLLVVASLSLAMSASAFVPPNHGKKVGTARWSGTWTTSYGPMHLVQDGTHVTGDYVYATPSVFGRIEGHCEGKSLRLRWTESPNGAGEGDALFDLSDDERAFSGTWQTDPNGQPGVWVGTRTD